MAIDVIGHGGISVKVTFILSGGVLIFLLSGIAVACSCSGVPNPPCRAFGDTPVIFTGLVTSITPLNEDGRGPRKVALRVERKLKGVEKDQVEVLTGDGGSDCGFRFEIGEKYLVYATNYTGGFQTNVCMRTTSLSRAHEDLTYIDSLPSLAARVSIFGSVSRIGRISSVSEPVENVAIKITSLQGGDPQIVKTGREGNYRVDNRAAGDYLIEPIFPGVVDYFTFGFPEERVAHSIPAKGCVEVNFGTYFTGGIRGKVVDRNGQGVPGYDVQLVSAEYEYKNPEDMAILVGWKVSRDDGTFSFEGVPPGRYRLGIGISGDREIFRRKGRVFYPNTLDPKKAKVIMVEDGHTTSNLIIPAPVS